MAGSRLAWPSAIGRSWCEKLHKYDPANRLLEDDEFRYDWDLNGNMIGKTEKVTGKNTRYRYDAENMLVHVDLPDGGASDYAYDPMGRRVLKRVVGTPTFDENTFFLYDNEDIVAEFDAGATSPKRAFLHGPNIDEPLAMVSGLATEFFHSDALGSVTNVSNPSAASTGSARYSSFGIQATSGAFNTRYSYTGREGPEETGVLYYRLRYYDAEIGRFYSVDPISWLEGWGFYDYVKSNPVKFIDPFGLHDYTPGQIGGSKRPSQNQQANQSLQCQLACAAATIGPAIPLTRLLARAIGKAGAGGTSAAARGGLCSALCPPPPAPPPPNFCKG